VDFRIVKIHSQNARHLAGSRAFSAGSGHKQRLEDAVRRVDQVAFFTAQCLVERQRKAVIGLGELFDRLWVSLGIDNVCHAAACVSDFAWFFHLGRGFFRVIDRVGFRWALHGYTGSQHESADHHDTE